MNIIGKDSPFKGSFQNVRDFILGKPTKSEAAAEPCTQTPSPNQLRATRNPKHMQSNAQVKTHLENLFAGTGSYDPIEVRALSRV